MVRYLQFLFYCVSGLYSLELIHGFLFRSGDGNVLMLVSSDGYCTVVVFDEHMSHYQTQQRDLQLRSVALAHSHSLIATTAPHPSSSSHPPQHHPTFSSGHSMSTGAQSPLVHPSPSPFVPPHAPSPAVSLKELPGPVGHSGVVPIPPAAASTSYSSGSKRPASAFDPPLTPAASVVGGDVDLAMGVTAGMSTENERDTVEEGPAKKRRRVELKHHGAV
jgi:chromatin assembly factor 1 subunit B